MDQEMKQLPFKSVPPEGGFSQVVEYIGVGPGRRDD
jgi:hypothetical protein